MLKLTATLLLTFSGMSLIAQKLIWTSEFGGQNHNGAIISYDLNTNQTNTLLSLEGNPMYGFNINIDLDANDVDYSGGLTLGTDGNYYGVNSHSVGVFHAPNLANIRGGKGFFYRFVKATGKIEVLHSFVGRQEWNSDLTLPSGGFNGDLAVPVYTVLETSPGVFYGVAKDGGNQGYGGVWKYDVNTNTYSVVGSFNDPANNVGRNPVCALIKGDGNHIYGLNKDKGGSLGYLFKINTSNDQMSFVADIIASGWVMNHPHGQLVYNASTNTIYGTKDRFDSSSSWGGGVWSYQITSGTVTPEWTILFSEISTLGSTLTGIIEAPDGKMYATTRFGGANGTGTIIKYSPSGNSYVKVYDFPANFNLVSGNGMKILGSKIIGTCDFNQNGAQLWSYDVFSNNFQILMNGTTTNPNHPGWNIEYGILIDNGTIVGRTRNGSLNGAGAIFSYDLTNGQPQTLFNCGSRKGRTIIGEMTQISDSTFVGYIGKGGSFTAPGDTLGAYELGGVAVFNLITGKTRILNNLLNNGSVSDGQFLRMNKPLLASNGDVYFNQIRIQPIQAVAWMYSHDLNTTSSPHFLYPHYNEISTVPGLIEIPGNRIIQAHHNKVNEYSFNTGTILNTYTTHNTAQYGHMDHNPLFASNGKIYGVTTASTAGTLTGENRAVIYSIDTTNFTFHVEHVFDSLIRTTNGRLTEYNGKLYGSTNFLGANNEGFLFSYDLANGTFTNEHSFSRATDGGGFNAGWTVYNGKLYSTSRTAGQNGYGTLVSYDIATSTFTTLLHLTMANGRSFIGTPEVWDDRWLGTDQLSAKEINFNIYPNPNQGQFFIDGLPNEAKVEIFGIDGKSIPFELSDNQIKIIKANKGTYLVRVITENASNTKKIILE